MKVSIDDQALDKAAREGYAVRCKTNGPRILEQYASPDIMQMQLDDARVIVSAYLSSRSAEAGKPVVKAWEGVETQEYTLRAMALNYSNGHSWDHLDGECAMKAADEIRALRSALSTPADIEPVHADDFAVDRFAIAMKAKLAEKRGQGLGGWDDPEQCHIDYLVSLLMQQIHERAVLDPIDIANISMMIHDRGETPDYGR